MKEEGEEKKERKRLKEKGIGMGKAVAGAALVSRIQTCGCGFNRCIKKGGLMPVSERKRRGIKT